MNKILLRIALFLMQIGVDKVVRDAVKETVIAVARELPNLTDEEKRKKAIKVIKGILKREGKELKDSLLNLLVEAMIQKYLK